MVKMVPPEEQFSGTALDDTDTRVLEMISRGATDDAVASALSITPVDVHRHVQHVFTTVSQISSQWQVILAPLTASASPAASDEVSKGVAALLEAAGGDQEQVLALLRETTRAVEERRVRPDSMTQAQADFLVKSGSMTAEELAEDDAEVARGDLAEAERQTELEPIIQSIGTVEAGELLGIDETRVRHRKGKGLLYAFKSDQSLRFPLWQFVDAPNPKQRVLPGLSAVVKSIPETMHPASVLGFMTTPQDDLLVDDEAVTPIEWLTGGGDPKEVVDLLSERDRW